MKNFLYFVILFFIGTVVYNVVSIDWRMKVWADQNQPYLMGILAAICGLLLTFIFIKYQSLKENRKN